MNTELLLALALALGIGMVVVALLLRSRQRRTVPMHQPARTAAPVALPAEVGARPSPEAAQALAAGAAAQVDARRHAATEALRQALPRKAEDAARLDAERASQARAEVAAHAQPRPPMPAPQRTLPPSRPRTAAQSPNPPAPAPEVPAERPSPLAIHTASPGAAQAAPSAPGLAPMRSTQPPRQPLVLLADDSKVVRVKTGRLLEKQGWRVLLAEDGAAALAALDSHAPDLLITDVEMPGLDGFALTRRVRAHARFARLPVIMITSSDERHRAEADAAGVDLLMGKPYAEEALLAQVQVMLAAAEQRAGLGLVLH